MRIGPFSGAEVGLMVVDALQREHLSRDQESSRMTTLKLPKSSFGWHLWRARRLLSSAVEALEGSWLAGRVESWLRLGLNRHLARRYGRPLPFSRFTDEVPKRRTIMRLSTHVRFTARSWRATLLAFAVCTSGLVAAQAPVTRTEISTDLLLALLGSGKAIEIDLPDDVRAVHVVATQGDAVVIDRTTEVGERPDDQATTIVVSVGAIGATLRCPLLVFIHVSLERAGRASGGGMTAACVEVVAPVALWPVPQGGLHEASFDVGTWYAVDGFWPAEIGPGAPQPTPDDVIIFHVYLATDDATPPIEELGITGR